MRYVIGQSQSRTSNPSRAAVSRRVANPCSNPLYGGFVMPRCPRGTIWAHGRCWPVGTATQRVTTVTGMPFVPTVPQVPIY
jgi:hypothetical protein